MARAVSTSESQFQIASVSNKAGAAAARKDLQVADSAFKDGRANCESYNLSPSSIASQMSTRMSSLRSARVTPVMVVGRQAARYRRGYCTARHKPKPPKRAAVTDGRLGRGMSFRSKRASV